MSLDSVGQHLNSAQTNLLLSGSMEPGILIAFNSADGDYDKAGADGDAQAVTLKRYDSTDVGNHDGQTPVKLINGEGTFILTTAAATVAAGDLFWQAADGLVSKTPTSGLMFECVTTPTGGSESGTKRFEARLRTDRFQPFSHTVTGAEGTANSVDLTSPWDGAQVYGVPAVNGAVEAGTLVTESGGVVTIAATDLAENDVITGIWGPTA